MKERENELGSLVEKDITPVEEDAAGAKNAR